MTRRTTSRGRTPTHKPGTYTVLINVTGPGGVSEWASTSAVVAPAQLALTGETYTWPEIAQAPGEVPLARFTYPADASGVYPPASSFVAAIDWRDGTPPTFAQIEFTYPGGGTPYYTVTATHTFRTPGFFTPYINVIAPDGESAWVAGKVAVGPDPIGAVEHHGQRPARGDAGDRDGRLRPRHLRRPGRVVQGGRRLGRRLGHLQSGPADRDRRRPDRVRRLRVAHLRRDRHLPRPRQHPRPQR